MDKDMLPVESGFFSQSELKIMVVGGNGKLLGQEVPAIDDATGTLLIS